MKFTTAQEVNGSDNRDKRVPMFRKLSASFPDPGKAEEWFDKLDQLKDNHIFDALDQPLREMSIINSDIEKVRILLFISLLGHVPFHS